MSATATGVSSSAGVWSLFVPSTATLDVYTTRATPAAAAASTTLTEPSTFARYIGAGSVTHSR